MICVDSHHTRAHGMQMKQYGRGLYVSSINVGVCAYAQAMPMLVSPPTCVMLEGFSNILDSRHELGTLVLSSPVQCSLQPGNIYPFADCRTLPHVPPAAELSSADVIAIADRLFAAETTWHQGSPLAQTVFTCLYLLEPNR